MNTISGKVSIIIPCFNASAWLRPAISSALSQSFSDKEVIVVDDGSTDDSLEIVQSFRDLIRWTTGPNRGVSAAMNTGFLMSTGSYIQYLGADDILHKQKLALSVEVLSNNYDIDFVWAPNVVFTHFDELAALGWDCPLNLEKPIFRENALDAPYAPSAALFRRSFLERVGPFNETLKRWVDLEYHARLAAVSGKHACLAAALYGYRRHAGPRISDANYKHTDLSGGLLALEASHRVLETASVAIESKRKLLFPFYVLLCRSAAAIGDIVIFEKCLLVASDLAPKRSFWLKAKMAKLAQQVVGIKWTSRLMERMLTQRQGAGH
jgi:hypothetical protein